MTPDDSQNDQKRLNRRIGLGFTGFMLAVAFVAFHIISSVNHPSSRHELHEVRGTFDKQFVTIKSASKGVGNIRTDHIILRNEDAFLELVQNENLTVCLGVTPVFSPGDTIVAQTRREPELGYGPNGIFGMQPYEEFWEISRNGSLLFSYDQAMACQQEYNASIGNLTNAMGLSSLAIFGYLFVSGRRQSPKGRRPLT